MEIGEEVCYIGEFFFYWLNMAFVFLCILDMNDVAIWAVYALQCDNIFAGGINMKCMVIIVGVLNQSADLHGCNPFGRESTRAISWGDGEY